MKILLIKTMMSGDVLFVTPAISAIRNHYPTAELHVLTGKASTDILKDNPCIDKIISIDENIFIEHKINELIRLTRVLRKEKYEMIINFHRYWAMHMFAFIVGVPMRIGMSYHGSGFFLTKKVYNNPHANQPPPQMYLDIVRAIGAKVTTTEMKLYLTDYDVKQTEELLLQNGIKDKELFVCICPGAASNPRGSDKYITAKCWNPDNFAKVGDYIMNQTRLRVILLGTKKEKELCDYISKNMISKPINLAGLTTIKTLAQIIKKAKCVITNDSLPLHIAISFNVPPIALFGATDSRFKARTTKLHGFIQSSLPCSPCWHNENQLPKCKHIKPICMDQIKVKDVINTIDKLNILE